MMPDSDAPSSGALLLLLRTASVVSYASSSADRISVINLTTSALVCLKLFASSVGSIWDHGSEGYSTPSLPSTGELSGLFGCFPRVYQQQRHVIVDHHVDADRRADTTRSEGRQ
jgi:hypothetical protein